MDISTTIRQGVLVIRVTGELDMHAADEFRQTADSDYEASGVKHILLNLKGVTFIDSSGLGVILGRYKKASAQGGKVAACHVRPPIARVFEVSGLLRLLTLYASEAEALENL